jgi:hypothetical protein
VVGYFTRLGPTLRCSRRRGTPSPFQALWSGAADLVSFGVFIGGHSLSNVVFILGAGASRQCGAPLMFDFLDVASNLLRSNEVQEKRTEFERVFVAIGALQVVHSKAQLDLNNIESIFTVLELGRIIQRVPGLKRSRFPKLLPR